MRSDSHKDLIQLRNHPTEQVIELLDAVEFGTNGAIYRHLDTRERIAQVDNPLFLSLERHNRTLANITFLRRTHGWYIRFFGFAKSLRAAEGSKRADSNSVLRRELKTVFEELLSTRKDGLETSVMYAYIDPQNDRSQLISKDFGFSPFRRLITQTYSRVYPKMSRRFEPLSDYEDIRQTVEDHYAAYLFFHEHHLQKGPFWSLKDPSGDIIAFAHTIDVHWVIKRLPGKYGEQLVKLIPYLPFVRRLLKPASHTFLACDTVWAKGADSRLIDELFCAILAHHQLNLIIWWTDEKDPFATPIRKKIRWGLLDKLVGRTPVNVMVRTKDGFTIPSDKPVFVSAFDMV